jgi:hypothetical protein
MTPPTPRPRSAPGTRRRRQPGRHAARQSFTGLWLLCGLFYAAAGVIVTSLAPLWVWALAAGGVVLQGVALAGPQALKRFRWLTANLLVLLGIVGCGALAVALAIALNHLGTDNIDDVTVGSLIKDVLLYSLLAVGIAGLCSLTTAALGDRILHRNPGSKTSTIVITTCLAGLALGGAIGLAIQVQ